MSMLTAIIGGSGLSELQGLEFGHREVMRTPYGEPSGALCFGRIHLVQFRTATLGNGKTRISRHLCRLHLAFR